MKLIRCVAVAIGIVGCSAAANATTFTFSYSALPFEGFGPVTTTTGTLDATQYGDFYSINSIAGTHAGQAIDGFDYYDFGQDFNYYGNGSFNNLDIEYSVGSTTYEATYDGAEGTEYTTDDSGTSSRFIETFALAEQTTTSAVPEPVTWAMMVGGFGLVGVALRRRRHNERPSFA